MRGKKGIFGELQLAQFGVGGKVKGAPDQLGQR